MVLVWILLGLLAWAVCAVLTALATPYVCSFLGWFDKLDHSDYELIAALWWIMIPAWMICVPITAIANISQNAARALKEYQEKKERDEKAR